MSEHSKGTELRYSWADGRIREVANGEEIIRAVVYYEGTRAQEEEALHKRDALGRKMAASPALVEAVRRALWHVRGDSEEWLRAAVEEYERTTGQTARAFVGHTTAFHLWCQAREAEDAAFLRSALKKAGVEP